jgi:hypothetical protein
MVALWPSVSENEIARESAAKFADALMLHLFISEDIVPLARTSDGEINGVGGMHFEMEPKYLRFQKSPALTGFFIWKRDADYWVKKIFGASSPKGRPPGSGSYASADTLLVTRMHQLVKTGVAKSALSAARLVAASAQGAGNLESKIDRLRRRYSSAYRVGEK